MSPEEWADLPWWLAQTYWEGLEAEFMQQGDEELEDDASVVGTQSGDLGTLSSAGFTVRKVQVAV